MTVNKKEILMIDQETRDEVNRLKASIKHYEADLNRPATKFIFRVEDSHDIARRKITADKKELAAIELAWGIK